MSAFSLATSTQSAWQNVNRQQRDLINRAVALTTPVIARRPDTDRPLDKVPGLTVRNATGDTAEMLIYGDIGMGGWFSEGITASDIAAQLAEVTAPRLNVRINSGGGDMFDGTAIYTQLVRHAAQVSTYVDGIAGSAASVIAMAGDEIVSSDAGVMMIHDASTMTYGNPADHRETADLLEKLSDVVATVYANRAGEDVEFWRAKMSAPGGNGTWYTGQEMIDAGLADRISGDDPEKVADHLRKALRSRTTPETIRNFLEQHPEKAEIVTPETQTEKILAGAVLSGDSYRYAMNMAHWTITNH
jgi:ATP-dependent protease ClpP protease subunit